MARFIRWVAEPFTVFGIGALLNLILSAAAYAGVKNARLVLSFDYEI
ncbi:hypothetical protein HNP47_002995 [Brevundimonas vesicularis]|uniref:Uncharacterized protein n=1 Tax=Brevundimonas vesicularis TaxID=41276 RepID=A0A7W9L708_BREVE|nr:hypothetical protein [Brevundimonas vesicularis]MBB5772975.1 hypothetical protein [Brevundimonas vesicularis]